MRREVGGEAECPTRRDAIHRVSHRPDGPRGGKNVGAGLCPERVRRDESRLYAADFPCGGDGGEVCGPIGAELPITAGEPQANLRKGTTPR